MGTLRFELRSAGLFLEAKASTDHSVNHCHRFLRLIAPQLEPAILARMYPSWTNPRGLYYVPACFKNNKRFIKFAFLWKSKPQNVSDDGL